MGWLISFGSITKLLYQPQWMKTLLFSIANNRYFQQKRCNLLKSRNYVGCLQLIRIFELLVDTPFFRCSLRQFIILQDRIYGFGSILNLIMTMMMLNYIP